MNGLERALAVIEGKPTDRQPYTLLLSLFGARFIEDSFPMFYRDASTWVKGQKKAVELTDPDIVTTPFAFPLEAEAFGSIVTFPDFYAPNIQKPCITDLSQIDNLLIPGHDHPNLRFILETTRLMAQEYGGNKAVASLLFSPCDLPALLLGIEKWIDTLLFEPTHVSTLLNATSQHFVRLANSCLSLGANFVVTTANFTNPTIVTEKMFKGILPWLKAAFEKVNGPIVIHHGGCKLGGFIADFAKLPNVVGIIVDPTDDLSEARKAVGEKLVLMGNLDGPMLEKYSSETAEKICLKILENRKADPHFIFASSNADIGYHTSVEVIKTVVKTIKNFKK
jgi:uroporphyrinogen decarboxylase